MRRTGVRLQPGTHNCLVAQSLGFYYSPLTYSSKIRQTRWPRPQSPWHRVDLQPPSHVRSTTQQAEGVSREGPRRCSLEDETRLVRREPGRGSLGESWRIRGHELRRESLLSGEAHAGGQGRAL